MTTFASDLGLGLPGRRFPSFDLVQRQGFIEVSRDNDVDPLTEVARRGGSTFDATVLFGHSARISAWFLTGLSIKSATACEPD